jgi:uncharacterized protein
MVTQRIAVTGASGLIGAELCALLERDGAQVLRLTRRRPAGPGEAYWDGVREIDASALEGLSAVVHLAGAGIAERKWTPEYKQLIRDSRVQGTGLLAATLAGLERPPRVFISASAVGYYGNRDPDDALDETAPPGKGFLAEVCQAWEAAAEPTRAAGIRTVHPRFGMVVSARGGALARMLPPFRLGLGGKLGSGRQAVPWVSLQDAVRLVAWLIEQPGITGPVNAVAPECTTNADLTQAVARALHRPAVTAVPAVAVRALFGEMGQVLLLDGARVVPRKALAAGFEFTYPTLDAALRAELGHGSR